MGLSYALLNLDQICTANKEILNDILEGTDLKFAKWAVNELVNWDNQNQVDNVIRIHGTKDKLIPWRGSGKVELIEDGEHFMIVDRAGEISKIINEKIRHNNYRLRQIVKL